MKGLIFALAMVAGCFAQDPTQQLDDIERAHRSLIQPPAFAIRRGGEPYRRTLLHASRHGIFGSADTHPQLRRPVCFCQNAARQGAACASRERCGIRQAGLSGRYRAHPDHGRIAELSRRHRAPGQTRAADRPAHHQQRVRGQMDFLFRGSFPRRRTDGIRSEPVPLLDPRMADHGSAVQRRCDGPPDAGREDQLFGPRRPLLRA